MNESISEDVYDESERELFIDRLASGVRSAVSAARQSVEEKRRKQNENYPEGCEKLERDEMDLARKSVGLTATGHSQSALRLKERAVTLREIQSARDGIVRLQQNPTDVFKDAAKKERLEKEILRLETRLAK